MAKNINNASVTEYADISVHSVDVTKIDGIGGAEEIDYFNKDWQEEWDLFNAIPKLKNAILMKAIWNTGRGYTASTRVMKELEHITGYGKQTFKQILFNMDVESMIGGDAYAEIIRDEESGIPLNLKVMNPGNVHIIRDPSGMILRYELDIGKGQKRKTFKPEQVLHKSYELLADQAHGTGIVKGLKKQILADDKLFDNIDRIVKYQSMPFVIFKVKSDDPVKIASFKAKLKDVRTDGEDLVVPDDENLLSWEVVQINPSSIILEWRADIRNEFYRAVKLPQVIVGQGGQGTESDSKVVYTAFEQIVQHEQKDWEDTIWQQLNRKINLIHPNTLLDDMQTDEQKDANQGLDAQEGINTKI